jgi:hypothetical protein
MSSKCPGNWSRRRRDRRGDSPSSREEAHHMLTTPVQRITGTCTQGTHVSSSPSKIPYGEFSPGRLQTGIPLRPSPTRSGSSRHPASAYTRLKSLSRKRATSRSGTGVQAALSPSDRTLPSRSPWLASGFCCPAGSTLTMTSSERSCEKIDNPCHSERSEESAVVCFQEDKCRCFASLSMTAHFFTASDSQLLRADL